MSISLKNTRGITLLVAVIMTSVILSVALALLDISYKQVLLSSAAKQSQFAFYNADSAMECILYWDQQKDAFDFTATPYLTSGVTCADGNGTPETMVPMTLPNTTVINGSNRETTLYMLCPGGGFKALWAAKIYKNSSGGATIFTSGYSSCDPTDPRRISRGLKITY